MKQNDTVLLEYCDFIVVLKKLESIIENRLLVQNTDHKMHESSYHLPHPIPII